MESRVSLYIYQRRGHTVRLLEMAVKDKFYCICVRNGRNVHLKEVAVLEVLLCVCDRLFFTVFLSRFRDC